MMAPIMIPMRASLDKETAFEGGFDVADVEEDVDVDGDEADVDVD
jgi:hypothetical protein